MIEDLWTHGQQEIETWKDAPAADLVGYIVGHYHLEARVGMARLETLAAEAALRLEVVDLPDLMALLLGIGRFAKEFRAHLDLEERNLFPWLLDPLRGWTVATPGGLMPSLVKLLEDEHEAESSLFRRLRGLTGGLRLPDPARDLQERLAEAFQALDRSLQGHLLLESRLLFRRVRR